jgi:cell division protease FtsH
MNNKTTKTPPELGQSNWNRVFIFFPLMALIFLNTQSSLLRPTVEIPYSQFVSDINEGKVADLVISDTKIAGEFKGQKDIQKKYFTTVRVADPSLVPLLREKAVVFRGEATNSAWSGLFSWFLSFLLVYWCWLFHEAKFWGSTAKAFRP